MKPKDKQLWGEVMDGKMTGLRFNDGELPTGVVVSIAEGTKVVIRPKGPHLVLEEYW